MMALAHFAIGVAGGLAILIWFPQIASKFIGNIIKNDVFFVLGSGFFAMLPDLNKVFKSSILDKLHDSFLSNIFWGHNYIDKFPDSVKMTIITITETIVYPSAFSEGHSIK